MTMTKAFLQEDLLINNNGQICYGEEQIVLEYPLRFATVKIPLLPTVGLEEIADCIRKDKGIKPIRPIDEFKEEGFAREAWYDFSIELTSFPGFRTGERITFIVTDSDEIDNGEQYFIELSEYDRARLYYRLDEQLREYTGKGCAEHLIKTTQEMENSG